MNLKDGSEDSEPASAVADLPLVVDLDKTLCMTDTLHEGILREVSKDPLSIRHLPGWVREGRAELKARLADRHVFSAAELPLNPEVLDLVETARKEGRRTALISAADGRQVAAIAKETGLFDDWYGSATGRNLKGEEKAAWLVKTYGERGFDYAGDAKADLAVWQAARKAITVGGHSGLRRAAEAANGGAIHIAPPKGRPRAILKAMRPHQWLKNTLVFVPVIAAHDLDALPIAFIAFIAFSLSASAIYVVNDLLDLAADRAHPRKRNRPFASGALSALTGVVLASGLLTLGVATAALTGRVPLLAVLAVYVATTFAYSLFLKRRLLVDVLTLAGLYTLRIIAGAAAAAVTLSPWMLGFSLFIFLALASVKRLSELSDQKMTGRKGEGYAYEQEDFPILLSLALSAGQSAVLVLALYISSPDVERLYVFPGLLWLVCPLLLYWILRIVMRTHRGLMTDDPIVFAATDRTSLLIIGLCAILVVSAAVWPFTVPQI